MTQAQVFIVGAIIIWFIASGYAGRIWQAVR